MTRTFLTWWHAELLLFADEFDRVVARTRALQSFYDLIIQDFDLALLHLKASDLNFVQLILLVLHCLYLPSSCLPLSVVHLSCLHDFHNKLCVLIVYHILLSLSREECVNVSLLHLLAKSRE